MTQRGGKGGCAYARQIPENDDKWAMVRASVSSTEGISRRQGFWVVLKAGTVSLLSRAR